MEFVYRVLASAIAVWVATFLPGINLLTASTPAKVGTLIVIALVFGVVNLVLKPVVKVVGCVFYLLTFGLIGLVVNALLLLLTDWIARKANLPFQVTGFWPAFWGAIVIAVVTFALTLPLHIRHLTRRQEQHR